MAHITALLIVLTLTGEPAANALCMNWCDSPSERQGCGAIANPVLPEFIATTTCVVRVTSVPFLREEGRSAVDPAAAVCPAPAVAGNAAESVRSVRLRGGDAATAYRPLSILVLRV
jgi:hypothetical protein